MNTEQENFQNYKQVLESVGLKATHQRIVIYAAMKQSKAHLSAEALFDGLRTENPSLSLGTVYRTLESFYQHNLIHRVSNREGKMLFDAQTEPHHHLFDESKNKLEDFYDQELDQLILNYFKEHPLANFQIESFQLQVEGKFID